MLAKLLIYNERRCIDQNAINNELLTVNLHESIWKLIKSNNIHAEIAKVERKVLAKLSHAHANQRFKLHTERRNSTATVARLNFRI